MKKRRRELPPELQSLAQNPYGVISRGPVKTTTLQRWRLNRFRKPTVSKDVRRRPFIDTVAGNAGMQQAGFGKSSLKQKFRRRGGRFRKAVAQALHTKLQAPLEQRRRQSLAGSAAVQPRRLFHRQVRCFPCLAVHLHLQVPPRNGNQAPQSQSVRPDGRMRPRNLGPPSPSAHRSARTPPRQGYHRRAQPCGTSARSP